MSKEYIFGSLIAGFLIGLGVIICALSSPPILGAFLFSFGLLMIIHLRFPLYTGRIGLFNDKWLPVMLLGNLIGVAAAALLYISAFPAFASTLATIAAAKFAKSFLSFFVCGIFCGVLIHFAVLSKNKLLTSMAVIIFILIGAEHCIAVFPYLLFCFSFQNLLKFLLIIAGNSIGAIILDKLVGKQVRALQ